MIALKKTGIVLAVGIFCFTINKVRACEYYGDVLLTEANVDEFHTLTRIFGGDLVVRDTSLAAFSLPNLVYVEGEVRIENNPLLQSFDLPSLRNAGAEESEDGIVIFLNPLLTQIDLPSLQWSGGGLSVRENSQLAEIFTTLETTDGVVAISDNDALETIDLSDLRWMEKGLVVENNPLLYEMNSDMLVATAGDVVLSDNGPVEVWHLPQWVGGRVNLHLQFPAVVAIEGLRYVDGEVRSWYTSPYVGGQTWVEEITFADLEWVNYLYTQSPSVFNFPGLRAANSLYLGSDGFAICTDYVEAPLITWIGRITIHTNTSGSLLDMPMLYAIGTMQVGCRGYQGMQWSPDEIYLPGLVWADAIDVDDFCECDLILPSLLPN